jgi:predicted ABC-type transport system involved in lysophospholipase L1 biosynthesis ATPase subunit
MAGLLEAPTAGEIYIAGSAASKLDERTRTRIRRDMIGFVYQAHHLLPEFTALENVILPQRIAGKPRAAAEANAKRLLTQMGLGERMTHRPSQLSGGEQQRVAIARAFVTQPALLFADEPTGNLDSATGERIIDLLFELNRASNTTLVVVTHDHKIAQRCGRTIRIDAGKVAA